MKEGELVLLKNYSPDISDQMQDCHYTDIPGGGKAMLPGFEIVLHFTPVSIDQTSEVLAHGDLRAT
jgi:hypothetical protein